MRRECLAAAVAGALIALAAVPTAAQQVPTSVDPAQIEKQFEVRPRVREEAPPELARPAAPERVTPLSKQTFVLTRVVVEGATVYGPDAFTPLYRDLLTKEVRLADLEPVAKKISDLYQADGYALSYAVVPSQEPSGGTVRIKVIEGYIGRIAFEGEVKGSTSLLESYGKKISAERPTTVASLERYLLLIEDLPGVSVRPLLERVNAEIGEYKLIVGLSHVEIAGFGQIDDRGTRFVGPVQLWAGANFNSVFGLYENTSVRFVTTSDPSELVFINLSHTEPLDSEGTTATLSGSYSQSSPGFTLTPLDINSRSKRFDLQVAHPLIRSRKFDLYVSGRFSYRDTRSKQLGFENASDRVRALRAGSTVSFEDGLGGRDFIAMELSQGLGILGASDPDSLKLSRAGASDWFTKLTLDLSRYQRLFERWGLLVTATGQKGFNTLLASEEIGIGGDRFGRAYDPAEIAGKSGAAGAVELQYDGTIPDFVLAQYQFYAYYDFGAVVAGGTEQTQTLASAGLGVRGQFIHGVFASLEVAKPLTRPVFANGDQDPRVFFLVRASF
ncbi:MAG: ShlB/FhaC/HecB family hemolysin secretion/activation protein [Alphaproteobacteria bacterium]